jgi:hypothetical protein
MSKSRYAHKGGSKRSTATFVRFEHRMLEHPRFMALSARACKALLFLASQYNGSNNGDLTIAWKVAKAKGLTANGNLRVAVLELIEAGFVVQTRQGGRNRCSLFALSWFPINECNGKLDVPATVAAPNDWLFTRGNLSEPPAVQCAPPGVQSAKNSSTEIPH